MSRNKTQKLNKEIEGEARAIILYDLDQDAWEEKELEHAIELISKRLTSISEQAKREERSRVKEDLLVELERQREESIISIATSEELSELIEYVLKKINNEG